MGGLVGREDEVARLEGLVRAVAGGRGGEVWVEGEAGIGKSAVLAAGLAGAERSGCQVFWAAAEEWGERFPLRVLLECLRVVPGSADPARREILDLLAAARSAAVVGASADPLPAVTDRLLALVDRSCAAGPVVLVVDDLHWADTQSLVVWRQLGWVVPQLPLLLVAACRPAPRSRELEVLRRAAVGAGAVVIGLKPLAAESVAALAGDLLGAQTVGPRLRAAVGQAAGNPLYVREMVDALAREGRVRRDGRAIEVVDAAGAGVPVSLAAAISGRLGFVSEPALQVLRVAALLGAEFSVTDLGVVTGRPVTGLPVVVEEGLAAGVLVESGLRLAFRHVLVRQVLYEGTPAAVRLALHRGAARALAEAGAAVERVAEQLLAALPETDAEGVVEGWVLGWLAGPGRGLAYRSPAVAAELLSRAVAHAEPEDPRREALQAVLVSVLMMLGRRKEAVELARRVRAGTREPGRAAEMTFRLARGLYSTQRVERAAAELDQALSDPAGGGVWVLRLRALRAGVAAAVGDRDHLTAAQRTLAEAEQAGDGLAISYAANAVGAFLVTVRDLPGALATYTRAMALLGDDPETAGQRLLVLQNRAKLLAELDRPAEADDGFRDVFAAAERYAPPAMWAAIRCGAAERHYDVGRWDEALAELEAMARYGPPVDPFYRLLLHGLWALIAARRDEQATAAAELATAADEQVPPGILAYYVLHRVMARAVLAERGGDPQQALAALAGMLDSSHGNARSEGRLWLPDLTRLAMATGDLATADAAVSMAAVEADSLPTLSAAATAGHCRGLLDAQPAPLLAAADSFRAVGRPVELAKALEDAAVLLAEHGDLPAARAAYAEAVERYTALRAEWDLLRADTRLRPYGIRRGRRRATRPATGWQALTPTELKVAYLVAEGNSNAEVAARLFLSRRTAEVHVARILTKLDARSRVEIARQAAIHGEHQASR